MKKNVYTAPTAEKVTMKYDLNILQNSAIGFGGDAEDNNDPAKEDFWED